MLGGHNGYRFFNDMFRLNLQDMKWTHITDIRGDKPTDRACFSWEVITSSGLSILIGGYGPKATDLLEDDNQVENNYEQLWNRYRDIYLLELPS